MIEEERKLKKLAKQIWMTRTVIVICFILVFGAGLKLLYKINRDYQSRPSSPSSISATPDLQLKFNNAIAKAYDSSMIVRGWWKISPQPDYRSLTTPGNLYLASVLIVLFGACMVHGGCMGARNNLVKLKKRAKEELTKERFKKGINL